MAAPGWGRVSVNPIHPAARSSSAEAGARWLPSLPPGDERVEAGGFDLAPQQFVLATIAQGGFAMKREPELP